MARFTVTTEAILTTVFCIEAESAEEARDIVESGDSEFDYETSRICSEIDAERVVRVVEEDDV